MQKIHRKEFVQGVAALGVATMTGVSFGKEGNDMKKTELKTLANENAFDLIGKSWMLVTAGNKEKFNVLFRFRLMGPTSIPSQRLNSRTLRGTRLSRR